MASYQPELLIPPQHLNTIEDFKRDHIIPSPLPDVPKSNQYLIGVNPDSGQPAEQLPTSSLDNHNYYIDVPEPISHPVSHAEAAGSNYRIGLLSSTPTPKETPLFEGVQNNEEIQTVLWRNHISGTEGIEQQKPIPQHHNIINGPSAIEQPTTTKAEETPQRNSKSRCQLSLLVLLLVQCLAVAMVFALMISLTAVMVDHETKRLVKDGVSFELDYARARVLAPITTYEKALLSLRQTYLAKKALKSATAADMEPCMGTAYLEDSAHFYADGMSVITNNPLLSFVYHLRRSKTNFRGSVGEIIECDANPGYIMTIGNISKLSTRPITTEDFRNLSAVDTELDSTDYFSEDYVLQAFAAKPGFTWIAYTYHDTVGDTIDLLISGHAPMAVERTFNNGSKVEIIPNLIADESTSSTASDPPLSEVVVSTLVIEASMTAFATLMRAISPKVEGAHTSLYDLANNALLTTSLESFEIFDRQQERMWTAGNCPSSGLNEAFNVVFHARKDTKTFDTNDRRFVTLAEDFMSEEVVVTFADDDSVVSSIPVTTTSGIHFLIVQSTPRDYYMKNVDRMRDIMIIVGAVSASAILVLCIAISFCIRTPLRTIEANMHLAAAFKNDSVQSTTSILSEVNALCITFDRMNYQLLQARPFMPQAILNSTGSDSEAESNEGEATDGDEGGVVAIEVRSDGDDAAAVSEQGSPRIGVTAPSSGKSSVVGSQHTWRTNQSAVARRDSGSRKAVNSANKVPAMSSNTLFSSANLSVAPPLVHKRVTILAINVRGFHNIVTPSAPGTIVTATSELTRAVSDACQTHKGVVDSFHGDHFVLSFNATKHNAQGPQRAVKVAMDLKKFQLKSNSLTSSGDLFQPSYVSLFSMGAASGKACVGQLGSDGMKRLSIIGRAYSKALALEAICKRLAETTTGTQPLSSTDDDGEGTNARYNSMLNLNAPAIPPHLLVDSSIATEIAPLYLVQLVGGSSRMPFVSPPANALLESVKLAKPPLSERPVPTSPQEGCIVSEHSSPFYKMVKTTSPAACRVERIYAIRQPVGENKRRRSGTGDYGGGQRDLPSARLTAGSGRQTHSSPQEQQLEWMYETRKAALEDPMLSEVNAALLAFLDFRSSTGHGSELITTPIATGLQDKRSTRRLQHCSAYLSNLKSVCERYQNASAEDSFWGRVAAAHAQMNAKKLSELHH